MFQVFANATQQYVSRMHFLSDAYECTATNIQLCLKDVSVLYWNATIAPVLDENEVVDICR